MSLGLNELICPWSWSTTAYKPGNRNRLKFSGNQKLFSPLTHWGWVTHICISKLTILSLDNGLSPGRCQAIIWTNARLLLTGLLGTNFSEIWIKIQWFSDMKVHLKMSTAKWRPFCLGPNLLRVKKVIGVMWSVSLLLWNLSASLQPPVNQLVSD